MFDHIPIRLKLLLVSVAYMVPMVYLAWLLVAQSNKEISFAEKERLGVAYIERLADFMAGSLDDWRSGAAGTATVKRLAAVTEVDARLGGELGTADAMAALEKAVAQLPQAKDEARTAAYAAVIAATRDLVARVGDTSNLILDPDLDSYYTMDLVVVKLPDYLDRAARVLASAQVVLGHGSASNLDVADAAEFLSRKAGFLDSAAAIDADLASAYRGNADGSIKPTLDPLHAAVTASTAKFGAALESLSPAATGAKWPSEVEVVALQTQVHRTTMALYKGSQAELDRLLVARIAGFKSVLQFRLWTVALVLLAAGVLVYVLGRAISNPLGHLREVMESLAEGHTDHEIPSRTRRDEVGAMARTVQVFKENAVAKLDLEVERRRRDEQAQAEAEAQRAAEEAVAAEVAALIQTAARGDLTRRIDTAGKSGLMLRLCQGMNDLTGTLQTSIGGIVTALKAMSEGNLGHRVQGDFDGLFRELSDSLNAMGNRLNGTVDTIRSTALQVHHAANEIAGGSDDLASRTEKQASHLQATASAMEQLTATVRQNAENSQLAAREAIGARGAAENGGAIVGHAVDAMGRISESSARINEIIGVIDEIAFQTNLLALNASVEAARAGEAGKGFAVVAQEVRSLAQRSSGASGEIKSLISASGRNVEDGVRLVNQAGEALRNIMSSVAGMAQFVDDIAHASGEQAQGLEDMSRAITQMEQMTQQNAALVEQYTASSRSMAQEADDLVGAVGFFRCA